MHCFIAIKRETILDKINQKRKSKRFICIQRYWASY